MLRHVFLRVVHGQPQGKQIILQDGMHVVGHGPECHIRPSSQWVCRQHCLLRVAGTEVRLRDLGSRNGTLLNGIRILEECLLQDGDLLEIGPLVLQIQLGELS